MWFLSARKSRKTDLHSRRSAYRPQIESLEDRCLLSAGALDPTFGNGTGYVTTSTTAYGDAAHNALIQPNGDIVALGSADTTSGVAWDFAAERYNPDGSLDNAFGTGGIALASFGSYTARGPYSALYPGGTPNAAEIVQEGFAGPSNNTAGYQALVRYNTNGTLDTGFGTGGEVMNAFSGMSEIGGGGGGVVVTSTGQIVALSVSQSGGQFVLARFNVNGSLDTSFGQGGYVITNVSGGDPAWNSSLLQQPNGDLIVSYTQGPNGTYNNDQGGVWDLYRFNANGTPDTSFGNQGIVTTAAAGGPEGIVLYPNAGTANDGKILAVGQAADNGKNTTLELARYNTNGSLDTTFGTGGLVQTQISFESMYQAALDANGRVVVTGYGGQPGSTTIAVARFNLDGTSDTTFGSGGLVTTSVGVTSGGLGLAIYPTSGTANDGDIVVAGVSNNGTKTNVLVARYLPQATSPYFVITGSTSLTAGTAGTFTLSVLNSDGSADTGYSGTVHITSSDPQAVLPADFTITSGTATFSATLKTAGIQSLTATDTVTSGINGSDASIQVNPSAATHFVITGPASIRAGTSFSVTVTALDSYGNTATGYTGTVHFSDSVGGATLPGNYTFKASDNGVHTFTRLKLKTKGTNMLTAIDTAFSSISGSLTVNVT
jgi:uncharacterized delta-60 repeat protein